MERPKEATRDNRARHCLKVKDWNGPWLGLGLCRGSYREPSKLFVLVMWALSGWNPLSAAQDLNDEMPAVDASQWASATVKHVQAKACARLHAAQALDAFAQDGEQQQKMQAAKARYHYEAGLVYRQQGYVAAAIAALTLATRAMPDNEHYRTTLYAYHLLFDIEQNILDARAYLHQGSFSQAHDIFERAKKKIEALQLSADFKARKLREVDGLSAELYQRR